MPASEQPRSVWGYGEKGRGDAFLPVLAPPRALPDEMPDRP
jgi:hypothetical protein